MTHRVSSAYLNAAMQSGSDLDRLRYSSYVARLGNENSAKPMLFAPSLGKKWHRLNWYAMHWHCLAIRKANLIRACRLRLRKGGAKHLVLALAERARLSDMHYDLDVGRELMLAHGFATIAPVHAEHQRLFHARNPFAAGGVYEDPATGAAAAALAGYLRDAGWLRDGTVDIIQGEDMGMRSRIHLEISPEAGASIRVSGAVRALA
jgi:PhzF family phenazine biosynthesis protein